MHVFQPYPISEIELNPFTTMGKAGICVTTMNGDKVNAMVSTFAGFGRMWEKNVAFIFVRESRYSKEILDNSEFFSISFFDDNYTTALKYIKSVSGRVEDKIENSGLHINKHIDIPFIDESNFTALCSKIACFPVDDNAFIKNILKDRYYKDGDFHQIYVGEILELLAR